MRLDVRGIDVIDLATLQIVKQLTYIFWCREGAGSDGAAAGIDCWHLAWMRRSA